MEKPVLAFINGFEFDLSEYGFMEVCKYAEGFLAAAFIREHSIIFLKWYELNEFQYVKTEIKFH